MGRLFHIGYLVFQRIQAAICGRANLFFIVSENVQSRKRSGVSISGTPDRFTSRILYNIFRKYVCTALNRPCNEIIPAQVPKTGISVWRHPFAKIDSIKAAGFSTNYIVDFVFPCETELPIGTIGVFRLFLYDCSICCKVFYQIGDCVPLALKNRC